MSSPARRQWQTKQHGTGQADRRRQESLNLHRARAQWPGRRGKRHSSFARREELPVKGPPPKTAFWFLCRRGQRNPPPERRNFPAMFFPRMERTKDPRGLAPRSASTPVACPRTPLRGTLPGWVFLASGAGSAADCPRFHAAAAGWAIQRRPGKLGEENAPGACSRRGWFWLGGRMRTSAPTPNTAAFP